MRVRCPTCRLDQDVTPEPDGKFFCRACGQKMKSPPAQNRTVLAGRADDAPSRPRFVPLAEEIRRGKGVPVASVVEYEGEPDRPASSFVTALGVASMVLGIISLLAALVPCVGVYVAAPLGVLGLILGIVGLCVSLARGGSGSGFSVVGMFLCVFAVVVAMAWWLYLTYELRENERRKNPHDLISRPPPPRLPTGQKF